ncbi:DUF3370 domain-containing protein [cf. Phormidesmis sp. LEGE 11477]|uniref:DUF3370 domain-containing protein n=1 Tax=cf. Phormidesmis sp. LEGE 11477 TaxID=1828680 RepID=UPI0018800C30|nr:DUF3370 domain-containing protein [cf. Phormidesmis sp. LEGE 11477]MBE9061437.1 DUF3370 domain-containing protein [cf. Phormidesmis sp. LEGE 11477]
MTGPEVTAPEQIAQAENEIITVPQEVRSLPGQLDTVPVFNSNSPEIIESDGILLSTFPPRGKGTPSAHLNYPLSGRFDIFSHHVARGQDDQDDRTVYEGIIVHNPGSQAITLSVREGASYISQESPWNEIASGTSNLYSDSFSGPGSRIVNDILRDRRHPALPDRVTIAPRTTHLLLNAPIPLRRLNVPTDGTHPAGSLITPPPRNVSSGEGPRLNGRSTLIRVHSSGPVYVASLAMHAPQVDGNEQVPTLDEWKHLLFRGQLSEPRDQPPSRPGSRANPFRYGRVSGISRGSQWRATLSDRNRDQLTIPRPGEQFSYGISTLERNTLGTGQIQSAPILARYRDTAYRANGNYGVEYNLTLPLHNATQRPQTIALSVQTPIQNDSLKDALQFYQSPKNRVFFRGTVLFIYREDDGRSRAAFTYLEQNQGQQGQPLVTMTLAPGEQRDVNVQFLYPPDATPPQVLTVSTLE